MTTQIPFALQGSNSSDGCGDRADGMSWRCTNHAVWEGNTVHMACWTGGPCGAVWLESNDPILFTSSKYAKGGAESWETIKAALLKTYPGEEEVQRAIRGTLNLLESMK